MNNFYTLITGATSGIGYALAEEFARQKHNLILASRNGQKMLDIKRDLENKYGIKVQTYPLDLSSDSSAEALYQHCQHNNYPVNVLVNNAGIGLEAGLQVEHGLAEVMRLLNLNLVTLVKLSTLFGQELKARKSGYILNVSSTAAFQPMPYTALYGASKAFVLSFSEAMAIELHAYGVGVTAVCPGITDTNFFKSGKPRIPGWIYKLISPDLVARKAIRAMYQKKIYIIPYFQHWLIAQLSRFLTRRTSARIMKNIETIRKRVRA